jgi:transcriptional regulator with XRE-family HTH domain
MIDRKKFATCFKELRQIHNMSMVDVAKALGLQKQSVNAWDKQKAIPSADTLLDLADLFDVSLDYLCGRSESRERLP